MSRVRTRYVPSPTGRMRVENLRAALYAYLIAEHEGGDLPLRIEDTDQERFVEGVVETIYQTLKDTSLIHDKGPDKDGGYGPYVQSKRQASGIYLEYAKKLVERGEAYYCFCTSERLASLKTTVNGEEIMTYDKHCLHLSKEEAEANLAAGAPYIIHQNNPTTKTTTFQDEIYGDIMVDNFELNDVALAKSDGYPTYDFANVVDDHLMGITHVVGGNEYLFPSPKYNRLYTTFGWGVPVYVHCPLITDESHHRLSKGNGHSSSKDPLGQGLISQAVVNYVALLGRSPGDNREISFLEEMVKESDYRRMNKSPVVFDMTKLKWMNDEYMEAMDLDTFHGTVEPYLKAAVSRDLDLRKIAAMVRTRIEVFPNTADHVGFFEALPECDAIMYTHKETKTNAETSLKVLTDMLPLLEAQDDFISSALYGVLSKYVEDTGVRASFVIWPIRITVLGKQMTSTGATEIIRVLDKGESLARIHKGIQMLEA